MGLKLNHSHSTTIYMEVLTIQTTAQKRDGAGNDSSANWTIPLSYEALKDVRRRWISRILKSNLHTRVVTSCRIRQAEPFLSDDELIPFLEDLQLAFPSHHMDTSILPFQPFRLQLFNVLLQLTQDPDSTIAQHLLQGIPSGAFTPLEPVGHWEPNDPPDAVRPHLEICQDNWKSANQDPATTRSLIQQEKDAGFTEEISSITEAERRWPKGIALGKLGVVCADNRDPRLVLDSTICGMNGRCHIPEKQRLPNLRHVSFFLSICPPLQDQWQGASIDIKAAHKRMPIREDERGALLFQFEQSYAYRTAHFGAKTSAWHWGRVSGALLRLIHKLLYFRHAAWVYVDDFLFLFPSKTAPVQFTLAIILLLVLGAPLSWKKLEFESSVEWNGWSIQPSTMIAQLPKFKLRKITSLILTLIEHPCRKNLDKIIGIILWATSLVHHTRFLLTSLYRDLFSIPATNYSIPPAQWVYFLNLLNDDAIISTSNHLHPPTGARVVEFKHSTISSKDQLPSDVPIERHTWIRLRGPNTEKRKLSEESKTTLKWILGSLLPLLSSIPLNRFCSLTINAAADAFATQDSMGIGGWVTTQSTTYWFSHRWSTTTSNNSSQSTKLSKDTSLHGKHLPNSVLLQPFFRNATPDPESFVSNLAQTTQEQKLISTMASPLY